MSFSDSRTPPPSWAVEPGCADHEARSAGAADPTTLASVEGRGGEVISMRTRRRVVADSPFRRTSPPAPGLESLPPPDPESDPRTRGPEPDPADWAREIVLRMLTGSPKTRSQLADGLRKRDCPEDVAEVVLDRLADVGLINDADFAANFVRNQQASKGLSGRALTQRLRARGVDAETAAAALEELDPNLEEEQARLLIDKKLRSMHGLEAQVQTRRLAGMLARKGYGSELSMRLIREAIANSDEHQRD